MATYGISGVWKDGSHTITHYAFHMAVQSGHSKATKIAKAEAIKLLEASNTAHTWIWNYKQARWNIEEKVEVIKGANGKYLRSNPDDKLTDNLGHLIDFDWIAP